MNPVVLLCGSKTHDLMLVEKNKDLQSMVLYLLLSCDMESLLEDDGADDETS